MESKQIPQEDEVELREYIKIIIKRKKLILSVFLIAVITALVFSLRMPKVYEITSTVQLGSFGELLIKGEEARAIMLNQNLLLSAINALDLKIDVEGLRKDIEISEVSGTNLLRIQITYPSIDKAMKINDAIISSLIAQGKNMYKERYGIIDGRLKELCGAIKNAEEDIVRTQNLIMNIPSSDKVSQAEVSLRMIILQNTLPKYENNLTDLRNQRNELQILLSSSKDFILIEAPIVPNKPLESSKKQNVIVASIFGLMFGVCLAFINK